MNTYTILIVEDDAKISGLLCSYINKYGFTAKEVDNFNDVLDSFRKSNAHLVLLDINLPKYDGYYWCRQIRSHSHCPILFISARDSQMDQVMALENGADDYITKPFHYEVVMAKIRSHLRRAYGSYSFGQGERKVKAGNLVLFPERFVVMLGEGITELTQKEAVLLETLMTKAGRVVSRGRLLDLMWEDHHFIDENTLNVYITRVRKKLKELGAEEAVETIRGVGYRLNSGTGVSSI
ncbi:DNA-binding response regulator, OmpR family, contains REC and winged-helix (wHTH) domain [Paenibacillus tianmuensis]|uniref:DNA-binding response regulator, OmpR family, contains REC and winged-helix (WHTH) domain n=1 Tax=Paenibacillus tianmuensis TaxID=624147 RepID=A0A1G4S3A0_9BACL|nr:response regulator transcription factor [Paenibacillus tianmuensis]SCW63471.1 DNA-binding response regulator, OmpR family, contains REC and winged-helix (wHTH) domain [Paenibacillus tianmuensis]